MDDVDQGQPRGKGSRVFTILFVIVIVLVVLGAATLFQRRAQYQALAKETETRAIPTVAVIHASVESAEEDLVLPGAMQAYVESPIYARTNGYLKKWYHDIGSRVRQGELLADIDTPEVDQQLSQARAELNTAQANSNLSKITATRYQELIKTDGVSKQEVDNAVGDLEAKVANVRSSEANVRRLEELESFKHIFAPFSGVITKRSVDTGTLINAGTAAHRSSSFPSRRRIPFALMSACRKPTRPPFARDSALSWSLLSTPARISKARWCARRSRSTRHPYPAHRSGRAEPQWRAAPRRLRSSALASEGDRSAAGRARERAAISFRRTSCRRCGCKS